MRSNAIAAALDRLTDNRAALWLVALLAGLAIHLIVWQFSEPSALFSDFYKANLPAAETLWDDGLSATWPLTEKGGFSNLPVIGWLYVPFMWADEEYAGWIWCVLGVAALLGAWALLVRTARLDAPRAALLAFLFLISGPIVNSLREGQSSHVILLFLVTGLVLWRGKRDYAAGLALGFCALIKLPLLLLGIYFVLRQRWAIVAGGATTVGVAALASLLLFGIGGNIGWYQEWVVPFLNAYIPAFNVQSVDGFLVRLSMGEEFLIHWDPPFVPTPFHRIARFATLAALFGGSFFLIWRAHRRAPMAAGEGGASPRDLLEFSLMINLALITSPISWTHYYLWLLIPWALYLGRELPLRDDATTRRLIGASIVMVSLPVIVWSPMEPSWYAAILSRTIVSVWLIGGCLSFAALARGLWQAEATAVPADASRVARAAP
jgi:alpha-1,2-mannosyltransferase